MMLDARDVLARYADFVWARDFRLERVAICEMGARKVWGTRVAEEGENGNGGEEVREQAVGVVDGRRT